MDKKELPNIITEVLIPIGYKKKGNFWVNNCGEISKIVNLQKSQFSNSYYVNYGFILKGLPLEKETMHVFNGLGSIDHEENSRIMQLMNLENDIADTDRKTELQYFLKSILISRLQPINTEEDLLIDLKKRPHLNDIPLKVKKYLKLG